MIETIRNAWKIPELRKKILFTLFVLLIYRLGACVPVPYVNVAELATYFSQQLSGTVLGLYNAMSGDGLRHRYPAVYQRIHYHRTSCHRHPCP